MPLAPPALLVQLELQVEVRVLLRPPPRGVRHAVSAVCVVVVPLRQEPLVLEPDLLPGVFGCRRSPFPLLSLANCLNPLLPAKGPVSAEVLREGAP